MQNPAVFDIFDLNGCIDPAFQGDGLRAAIGHCDGAGHLLQRLDCVEAVDRHRLLPGQPQGFAGVAAGEFERDHTHAHQVGPVDALKAFGDHSLNA